MRLVVAITLIGSWFLSASTAAHAEMRLELPRDSPALALLTQNFYLDIHQISYKFNVSDNATLKLYGLQDGLPNPEDISSDLDVKSGDSFDLGLNAQRSFGDFYLGADLNADVTGTHSGYRAQLNAGYVRRIGSHKIGIEGGVRYQDKKRSNYYFGVAANEVNENLRMFNADEAVSAYVEAGYASSLTNNLGLFIGVSAESISDAIQESPRIESDNGLAEVEATALLIWQFSVYGS